MNSYKESDRLYRRSIYLSKHWISKYFPKSNYKFADIDIEKAQFFSQHYFFLSLLLSNSVDNVWSQYPACGNESKFKIKDRVRKFINILEVFLKNLVSKQIKLSELKFDVVVLSSGRHLKDLMPLIVSLKKNYKLLVIGKMEQQEERILKREEIIYFNFKNPYPYLSFRKRLRILLFFLFRSYSLKGDNFLFENKLWKQRLLYLRIQQFPAIAALLEVSDVIFKRAAPKLLITSTTNDVFAASFTLMAKKNAIPVAEIQHGAIAWQIDYELIFPDYFLVWGKIPANIYTGEARKIIVGAPFINKPVVNTAYYLKRDKPTFKILVLLSPPYGYLASYAKLENRQSTISLIKHLQILSSDKFKITIRSHPSYPLQKDLEGIHLESNFFISSDRDVEKEIENNDIVITGATTAGLIAILHKKPLFYYDNSWLTENFSHPYVRSGSAINVSDAPDLLHNYIWDLIEDKNKQKGQKSSQDIFIDNYFKCFDREAIKNIETFIKNFC